VHSHNVQYPIRVYEFFKQIGAQYLTFLPLIELQPDAEFGVSHRTVKPNAWGTFLCNIFDKWIRQDIGQVNIQIFEEAASTAFDQEHALCIFRKTCGDIPVIEHNGDFFTCDHFVNPEHCLGNIQETQLVELIESPTQRAFGQSKSDALPRYCLACEVLDMCYGGCPKDRILQQGLTICVRAINASSLIAGHSLQNYLPYRMCRPLNDKYCQHRLRWSRQNLK
jgi:uncharacterized protein